MNAFSAFIVRRALWVVIFGTLLSVAGFHYSVELYKNLRTNFEELLPTNARSVVDLGEVTARLQSIDSLGVLVFSDNIQASKRFVIDLARKLNQEPKSVIASVEYEIQKELKFFRDRQALYMDLNDLIQVRDYVAKKIEYEKALYNPLNIFSEREIPEPVLDLLKLKNKYSGVGGSYAQLPDGFYATKDEKKRAVLVYKPADNSGIEGNQRMRDTLDRVVAELKPASYAKDLEVKFTGGVQDALEEHHALIEDLELSTIIVVIVVAVAMLIYYRSFWATAALNIALFMGTFWTFGASYFAVGYLNANSAFLGSIVIGNGVNFGIILLARYIEERRNGFDNAHSIRIAISQTATSTFVAALAAGMAYGSLILTDFRGFRQFGIIGLIGMILCWLASYTMMPALLTIYDRFIPIVKPHSKPPKAYLSLAMAWIVDRFPRAIWGLALGLSAVSIAMFSRYTPDILETNLSKLRNKHSLEHGSAYLSRYQDEIFQRYLSPMVVLPKDREDARKIAELLRQKKKEEGDRSLIHTVQTLDDFLPKQQAEKIRVLHEIRQILPGRIVNRLSPEDRSKVALVLNPINFNPIRESDLPKLVIDKFTEKDGTVGKLVLVEPPLNNETWKGDRLIAFIHELRDVADQVSRGAPVAGTIGITSDMIEAISRDGPRATLFAFLAVVVLVILLFRHPGTIAICLFSLLLGVLWLAGIILGTGLKINFLNFIALPITFGIGVDYGVNIFQRYRQDGAANILGVIRQTGGAVMLASFTTITGYCSLLIAGNQGFVSFGALAVAGEVTCVIAAVIALPAYLLLRHRKQLRRALAAGHLPSNAPSVPKSMPEASP